MKQTQRMGMKLKFLPICTQHPRTTSFAVRKPDEIYKTINSVYFDPDDSAETPDSWFTNSAESLSGTSSSSDSVLGESSDVEAVIRGAQQAANQRLFFEPGGDSSSLLGGAGGHVTVAVESRDPHVDFKRSMAEMAESLGVRSDDFDGLKELLGWYLKVNEESNHGYILGAFVDFISGINFNQNQNENNNNINKKDDDDDDDDDESGTSFSTAAAASLTSSASTRLLLGQEVDSDPI